MRIVTSLSLVLLFGSFVNATEMSEDSIIQQIRVDGFFQVYEKHGQAIRLSSMLKNCNEKELAEMVNLPKDAVAETTSEYLISIKTNPKHKYYTLISKMNNDALYERIVEDINGYVNGYRIGFKEGIQLSSDITNNKMMCDVIKEKALKVVYQNLKSEKTKAEGLKQ